METRILTIGRALTGPNSDSIPFLRITGIWLLEAGFRPGNKIAIEVVPGKLTIRPLSDPAASPELTAPVFSVGLKHRISRQWMERRTAEDPADDNLYFLQCVHEHYVNNVRVAGNDAA